MSRLAALQDVFSNLLGDPNELTQEMASRGVSIVFGLGDEATKKQLVEALVGVLGGGVQVKKAVKVSGKLELENLRLETIWLCFPMLSDSHNHAILSSSIHMQQVTHLDAAVMHRYIGPLCRYRTCGRILPDPQTLNPKPCPLQARAACWRRVPWAPPRAAAR